MYPRPQAQGFSSGNTDSQPTGLDQKQLPRLVSCRMKHCSQRELVGDVLPSPFTTSIQGASGPLWLSDPRNTVPNICPSAPRAFRRVTCYIIRFLCGSTKLRATKAKRLFNLTAQRPILHGTQPTFHRADIQGQSFPVPMGQQRPGRLGAAAIPVVQSIRQILQRRWRRLYTPEV